MPVNKILNYVVGNFLIVLLIFGVILPLLISAKATELVILGILMLYAMPYLFWHLNKDWIMKLFDNGENKDE